MSTLAESRNFNPTPEESDIFQRYWNTVRGDSLPTIRASIHADLQKVFFDGAGEPRNEKEATKEITAYREVVKAKVGQITDTAIFHTRQAQTEKIFRKSPRTMLKTVQEILCADTELQVFTREEIAEKGGAELIKSVVIDPRKITNSMLRNFGLDEYIPRDRKLSSAERMAMRAEAIPSIKEFLCGGLEPLHYAHEEQQRAADRKFFRLFRITRGKNEGMILGIQENSGERPFLTDIHSASRRVDHIEKSYEEEMEKLNHIRRILDKIRARVLGSWQEVRDSDELERIKMELCGIVDGLKFTKGKIKIRIKDKVAKCVTFKDRRGQTNPGSRLAILATVKILIDERIGETANIMGYLSQDRIRVGNYIVQQAGVLADFHGDVERYSERLILLNPGREIDAPTKQRIITNLSAIKAQCQSFVFEPYRSLAERVVSEIDTIIAILESADINNKEAREKAGKSFVIIYIVSKLLKLEIDIVELREEFFAPGQKPENVYIKSLVESVETIRSGFAQKRIAGNLAVDDFSEVFGEIYKMLNTIKQVAQQSLRGGAPKEKRIEALQQIGRLLRNFDPYGKLSRQQRA